MNKIYKTDRLTLKILDKRYAKTLLDYYLRNKEFLEEWEALKNDEFYTLEYHEKQLESDLINIKAGNLFRLWIFKKDDESRTIGTIGFSNIVGGPFLSCYLGYKLDKDEINQGIMTEAIKEGIAIMFNEFKLHRIEANIMPKNKRSLKVAEKLGFYNEGLAYKYLRINGVWEDHIHMVLINENLEC